MKKKIQKILFLFLTGLTLFITTCKKENTSEEIKKETITNRLNFEISADTLESLVTWLQDMGTRFMLSDNNRNVAVKIRDRFTIMGYQDTRLDSFMINKTYRNINYQQWKYNVIATLPGKFHPDSVCIIGAHYDNYLKTGDPFSFGAGANDNASGVAATLEIARVIKRINYSPLNTIEFIAFGAEELGHFGSIAYASGSKQSSKGIKFMLNNDMIAYEPLGVKSEWTVNILDYDNSHDLRIEAEELCSKFTILKYTNDNTFNKLSDSYPFFRNGFKAIYFTSLYFDPNLHTLNDEAINCNFEYCREIVKISCALLVNNN